MQPIGGNVPSRLDTTAMLGPCPLCSDRVRNSASQRTDALCHKPTWPGASNPCNCPYDPLVRLPDQSTALRLDSSSTDDSRLRGALPGADLGEIILSCFRQRPRAPFTAPH